MKKEVTPPEKGELVLRMQQHLFIAKNDLERREIAIAWSAFAAGLIEFGVISRSEATKLYEILRPHLKGDNPVYTIAVGIPDEELERLGFKPDED